MNKYILLISALVLMVMAYSCKEAIDDVTGCRRSGSLSYTADGGVTNANFFDHVLIKESSVGSVLDGKVLQLRSNDTLSGRKLFIEIFDFRDGGIGNCIRQDTFFSKQTRNFCITDTCVSVSGSYTFPGDTAIYATNFRDIGFIVISKCDSTNRTVSGNFNFLF